MNTASFNLRAALPDHQPAPDAFWIVWNPEGRNPTHRHGSESSANNEAERLARMNPGQAFIVLRAVGARSVDGMQRVTYAEPIPF